MLRVALKGLAGRKLRALLTAIAIILGVAMISGTYVLTDTINNAFTSIFTQTYKNADAIISGKTAFTNDNGNGVQTPSFSESLLAQVQGLPDVSAAEGSDRYPASFTPTTSTVYVPFEPKFQGHDQFPLESGMMGN